jgi:glutathione peroxidase
MVDKNIYSFTVKNIEGEEVCLEKYKGKVLLIVNTASDCGYTPQYKELEELYKTYKQKGFEVLAFPSNDFGNQEPLNGKEIAKFCSTNFECTFPIFEKVHVYGHQAIELYKFLADKKLNKKISSIPRWNFHKYLIDSHGKVVNYFYPFTKPTSSRVKKAIEKLLR